MTARRGDAGDAVQAVSDRRSAMALSLLEQARKQGELRADADADADADPETVLGQVAGALYHRVLVTGRPRDAVYVDRLVGGVLRGVRALRP
ncbi:TetR/AcrR family transcriptional regulator C-terminal ligand-binding domain-containing protein [Streptomyces sp. NBC_01794]|nr:TetR/AcrR family transcriptional regulator C-terminal ligand-binding domain-containing protein [Streptomyces sp. NBC_01794]